MNQCGRVSEVASEIPRALAPNPGKSSTKARQVSVNPCVTRSHVTPPGPTPWMNNTVAAPDPRTSSENIAVFDGDQGIRLRSAVQLKGVSVCNIGQATTSDIQIEAVANDENVLDLEPDPAGSHVDQAP